MQTSPSRKDRGSRENRYRLYEFEEVHKEEIEAVSLIVAKITHRTPEEVKPHLKTMLVELVESNQPAFDPQQWELDMKALAEGADDIPMLPPEAFSRESIYSNHD